MRHALCLLGLHEPDYVEDIDDPFHPATRCRACRRELITGVMEPGTMLILSAITGLLLWGLLVYLGALALGAVLN